MNKEEQTMTLLVISRKEAHNEEMKRNAWNLVKWRYVVHGPLTKQKTYE